MSSAPNPVSDPITQEEFALLDEMLVDRRPKLIRPKQLRFAFYGRVSTDDLRGLQDSKVSRAWQYDRAQQLVQGNGEIVAEYFDEGVSRTIPMFRREKGSELLDLVENGQSRFHAIVVGEAKRVFAGSQLEDVYHMLARAGIELWIPELGGRYDDSNMSHRMMLAFEGIIGRNESDTARNRVRDSMRSIAKSDDRRWLGGKPPYGYRLAVLDRDAKKMRGNGPTQTLELDPGTSSIARRIFEEYLAGKGLREISQRLERDGILSPSGKAQWSTATLSTILSNQTYTGVRIYGKQQKIQILFDESNPRLGTVTKRTRNTDKPVRSSQLVYPAIVSITEFSQIAALRLAKQTLTGPRMRVTAGRERLPLQGRITCRGKKMTLDRTRHGKVRYRWRDSRSNAQHTVYAWAIQQVVDEWLTATFAQENHWTLVSQLVESVSYPVDELPRLEGNREKARTAADNLLPLVEDGEPTALERYRHCIAEIQQIDMRISQLAVKSPDPAALRFWAESVGAELATGPASTNELNQLYDLLGLEIEYRPTDNALRIGITPTMPGSLTRTHATTLMALEPRKTAANQQS